MRIVHVAQPVDGGVVRVVESLVADQVQRGWDVHVACPTESQLHETACELGAAVHTWEATRSPGAKTWRESRRLRRILRDTAPDVVHLHSSKAGMAGRIAVRGRVPTIFMPHMWSFEAQGGIVIKLARHWEVFAARWTTTFLCVSDDEARAGRAAGIKADGVVVENGVDLEHFRVRDRQAARADLGVTDAPTVSCVGRLAPQKGQDLLLEAWPEVLRQVPEAQLLIVGGGEFGDEIRRRYPDSSHSSITWIGSTSDPRPYYAAADVVAMPSRSEGMALVPLEALAMARPVVAFDVGGADRTIGEAGTVLPVGDIEGLAKHLAHRLSDPALAAQEGVLGRRRVEELFDLRGSLDKIAKLTSDVAAQGHQQLS